MVMKKDKMKKKGMARGGAKMPMAKDPKTGKMMPAFAMDGKGKMAKGGQVYKRGHGGKVIKNNMSGEDLVKKCYDN